MSKLTGRVIGSGLSSLLLVGLIGPPASGFENRNFWRDDCPNPIVLQTGTIGYHYSYAEQYSTRINKDVYWGWVELPNPYRSWTTYSTTAQIYTETSASWYARPYLECDYYG